MEYCLEIDRQVTTIMSVDGVFRLPQPPSHIAISDGGEVAADLPLTYQDGASPLHDLHVLHGQKRFWRAKLPNGNEPNCRMSIDPQNILDECRTNALGNLV